MTRTDKQEGGRLRIGIIGSRGYPYVYSGYETFVREVAERLTERGHQVTVYCHRNLFTKRPSAVRGIELIYTRGFRGKSVRQLTHSLTATLDASFRQFDVVLYVNVANGPFGAVMRLCGAKTAINVDGLEWLRPKWKGLGAKYFRTAAKLATALFDVVVTDADAMGDIYYQQFGVQSETIAYGAYQGHSETPQLIDQFNISPDSYYLVVGRLIPDNNADVIVREFLQSSTCRKLVIVGDVPYQDAFAASVREAACSRIIFTGYVRDSNVLRELYCNAYAYIHGHEFGGTNPTLLHALGWGCCVVALDTVFTREVLAGELHAVYFTKGEGVLRRVLDHVDAAPDRVQEFRSRARQRIAEKYNWEYVAEEYEALFKRMTGTSQ